jgi:hypothetical protein
MLRKKKDTKSLTPNDGPAGNGQSRPDALVASIRTFGLQSYQVARDENDYHCIGSRVSEIAGKSI